MRGAEGRRCEERIEGRRGAGEEGEGSKGEPREQGKRVRGTGVLGCFDARTSLAPNVPFPSTPPPPQHFQQPALAFKTCLVT